jgi:Domain of unknown function (DUF6457)
MTGEEWLAAFAAAAGVEVPSADDIDTLLDLAGIAAHASERTAAPVTCWIAATAGLNPTAALALAESLSPTGD